MKCLSRKMKIGLLLGLVILFLILLVFSPAGCAVDIRGKATAFDGRIEDTTQTSLTSGRPARD